MKGKPTLSNIDEMFGLDYVCTLILNCYYAAPTTQIYTNRSTYAVKI